MKETSDVLDPESVVAFLVENKASVEIDNYPVENGYVKAFFLSWPHGSIDLCKEEAGPIQARAMAAMFITLWKADLNVPFAREIAYHYVKGLFKAVQERQK